MRLETWRLTSLRGSALATGALLAGVGTLGVLYRTRVARLNAQRAQLEEMVSERTSALVAALGARDAFLRLLAHDLKTPLAAMSWQAELLLDLARTGELDPARFDEGLRALTTGAAEAIAAIDELRDLTQIEAGAPLPLHVERLDLHELVREVVVTGRATAWHVVDVRCDPGQLEIAADRARMARVLANLLENAAKYSPEGSTIVVALSSESTGETEQAVVRVSDSGIGIPRSDLPHVFERYHRGANVESVPGEGLGLASVRALVQLHEGSVSIESCEGRGTSVWIRLPVISEAARDDSQVAPPLQRVPPLPRANSH